MIKRIGIILLLSLLIGGCAKRSVAPEIDMGDGNTVYIENIWVLKGDDGNSTDPSVDVKIPWLP